MKVAFDVTSLLFHKAGIYNYYSNLLKSFDEMAVTELFSYYFCDYFVHKNKVDKSLNAIPVPVFGFPSVEERLQKLSISPVLSRLCQIIDQAAFMPLNQCINHRIRLVRSCGLDRRSSKFFTENVCPAQITHHSQEIFFYNNKTRNVITIQDLGPIEHPEVFTEMTKYIFEKMLAFALKNCDAIITPSHFTKSRIAELSGYDDRRIAVIHHGVSSTFRRIEDSQTLSDVLRKYSLEAGSYILFIGTIEPRKNIEFIIKAFNRLPGKHKHVKLVIAGKYGWKFRNINKVLKEKTSRNRIVVTGFVPDRDLPFLLNGAKMFVFPSLYEGFGIPPLEAMACGVPVICSNKGALKEVVKDAALIINPYDVDDFAKNMEEMLTEKDLRDEFIEKGLYRAERFSWKSSAVKHVDFYQSLLG